MSHQSETPLVREIMRAIGALPGVLVYRNSQGLAKHTDDHGKQWHVPYGLGAGTPDLIVFVWGQVVGLECKTLKGKARQNQLDVQKAWRDAEATYEFVRDAETAVSIVQNLRQRGGR